MRTAEEYNEFLRQEFERTGTIEALLKYVMSETLTPIEDYKNAVKIIREYKDTYKSSTLLIIGAHMITDRTYDDGENDLLNDLIEMREELSEKELAIMHFLIANHIHSRNGGNTNDPVYQEHIMRSMQYKGPFVENRLLWANYYRSNAPLNVDVLKEAIENVVHVSYDEDIKKLSDEDFVEPEFYINEFILGTEITDVIYERLLERAGLPIKRHKSSSVKN